MLPFTIPDEPLYLIYTINRVVQVRAGMLESNIKDFLNLVQGNVHKSYGNGMAQLDKTINPGDERTMAFDGNQTLSGELQDQNLYGEDLYRDPNTNPMTLTNPCSISASDTLKIQVHSPLFYLFHICLHMVVTKLL